MQPRVTWASRHRRMVDCLVFSYAEASGMLYLVPPVLFAWFAIAAMFAGESLFSSTIPSTLLPSITNGFSYAVVSSFLQVIVGLCVAWTLTLSHDNDTAKWQISTQACVDCLVVIPYTVPSVCWKWLANDFVGIDSPVLRTIITSEALRQEPYGSLISCHIVSLLHLFPFSYLAFRFFFATVNTTHQRLASCLGLSGPAYFVRYHGPRFLCLTGILLLLRIVIMQGKFDLPFLFSGETIKRSSLLFTLPIWVEFHMRQVGLHSATRALCLLFFLTIFAGITVLLLGRWLRKKDTPFLRLVPIALTLCTDFIAGQDRPWWCRCIYQGIRCVAIGVTIFVICLSVGTVMRLAVSPSVWAAIPYVLRSPHYVQSLVMTALIIPAAAVSCAAAAYAIRMTISGRCGWGVSLLLWASMVYFMVPPTVYLSFSGFVSRTWMWPSYAFFLVASILPIAVCQLVAAIPSLRESEYLFLSRLPVPFVESFWSIHGASMRRVGPILVLMAAVVVTNELFGAYHILRGGLYPMGRYLWDARDTFFNDMSRVYAASLPIAVMNWGLFAAFSVWNAVAIHR